MLSKCIWEQVATEMKLWYDPVGSLHVAHGDEEWNVLRELAAAMKDRKYQLLTAEQTINCSPAVVKEGLTGGLYSPDEMIVDPREAICSIPRWLTDRYGVQFLWGKAATDISYPSVYAGPEEFEADAIYVCSGADFETLYPGIYSTLPVTKCKLQMMRMGAQPGRIGPALCGGLSLIHYNSFKTVSSWPALKQKLEQEYPDYIKRGIHVMVSQNQSRELTVGDSHEYGLTPDPFDRQFINQLILDYLKKFARFRDENITETWNGVYPKFTNGQTELVLQPEQGVTIINCMGGAGMTLGFGLCEQVVASEVKSQGSAVGNQQLAAGS